MYYFKQCFQVTTLHVYGEFAPLQELIQEMPGGTRVNQEIAIENVPDIDRQTRVTTETIRSIRHSQGPKIFLIHFVFQAIKMLNHFPVKGGISNTIIPTTIITSDNLHYKKHLGLHIGQYCQVHE